MQPKSNPRDRSPPQSNIITGGDHHATDQANKTKMQPKSNPRDRLTPQSNVITGGWSSCNSSSQQCNRNQIRETDHLLRATSSRGVIIMQLTKPTLQQCNSTKPKQ